MANVFRDFYDHVFKLLDGAVELSPFNIDPDNIHPSNDVVQPKVGVVVHYGWTGGSKDVRQRRATGTFEVRVTSADNKLSALDILEVVASVMTPRRLTDASDKVIVHMFRENDALDDENVLDRGVLEAETDFTVKLVEAI